jgi:glycosyltransferase involved in cell wall biosynthesis
MKYRFAFVLEQTGGHVTWSQNLERCLSVDNTIRPTFIPIRWPRFHAWEHVPPIRDNWSLRSSLKARWFIERELSNTELDGLVLHTQTMALCARSPMRRVPTIISTDATPYVLNPPPEPLDVGPVSERLKHRWHTRVYEAAAALVAWNRWAKDSLVNDYGVPEEKVEIIPPGVDLDVWHPAPRPRGRKLQIFFGGNDFVRKGGHVLLEAYQGLSDRADLHIACNGGVPDMPPGVFVHRNLKQNSPMLRELFQQADLFVLPSFHDCSPLAIIEAMGCGLPVISTIIGGIPEQVDDGVTGLLVPAGDARALRQAIEAMLNDPSRREAMGHAARQRALDKFDACKNAGRLVALLKRCARRRSVL